ncbi:hypothetical protein J2X31_003169 [Flavobacterium arsenatis]|uniref:Fibronectin type-III domain-containing protein n=1 Tax=Flavobacterium arsenatis TaxID=1484332 RepID=A0ABU1TTD7_9FLAO|nr:choice-of-anchor J domain-containing protein [Flavobacterium arsenatis]MDR6969142.1 hypothetical protein [Flavobacterium arsenatis]
MKKITFCLLLFLAMFQSQGQVLIGNGSTLKNLPINPNYGYSYSQSIYTAAEINAAGEITGISWLYGGPAGSSIPNSQNLKVFLGHTTKSAFSNSGSDWEATSNLTEVYQGGIVVNGPGWASITFTTPFNYNGTDNLIVATAELSTPYDPWTNMFVSHELADNRSMIYQSDGTLPNLESPQNGNAINFLPNIIFSGIQQSCPTPFFLTAVVATNDFAVVVWTNGAQGPDNSSQYYLSVTNEAPTSSTEPTGSGNPAMLNSLEADTLYYIWVRNFCDGTAGEWSYPTSFRTECNTQTSFTENFDTTPVNSLPACWSSIVRGPGTGTSTTALTFEGEAFTGTNSARLFNGTTGNAADIILVSPKLSNLATNTHRLRFYADSNNTSGLVIGTLNNNTINATFTPLPNATIEISTEYQEYAVSFSDYTGTDTYIGFRLNAPSDYSPVSLDNIRWEPVPACGDVTEIAVGNIQPETVTVSWAESGETGFEVAYDLVSGATDPNSLTPSTTANASIELTDLIANSHYNVWVRSTCESGVGSWFGPTTFKSECYSISGLNENFDSVTAPALPDCWTSFIRGASGNTSAGVSVTASGSSSAPNAAIITPGAYITVDTDNDVILVGPNSTEVGAGTHRLKFSVRGNGNLQVGTLNNTTSTAIFTSLENITVTNSYQEFVVDFSAYQGNDTHFGFRVNNTAAYSYTYIDNVKWEVSPACPDVQSLVLESITPNSATISWEESGTEDAWEIVYGAPDTTDPSTLTDDIIAADESIKEITGLEDYTSYAAWVRSDCGTDKGAWIGPIFFKTDCLPTNALNENFDAVANNSLPACWTSIVRGTTGTAFAKVTTSYAHTPSKSVEMYNQNQTDDNDVILVSPNLGNLSAGTHRLRFFSSFHNASSVEVGTLDLNTPNAVFTAIEEINLTNNFVEYTVDFTQWTELTDQYIGIRLSKNGTNSYAHIDDVVWEVAPLCPSVINVEVSDITPETAFATWEMGEQLTDNWEISYATSDITDADLGIISETANMQEHQFEGLTPNTQYNVWVRSLCEDNNGEWVGPKVFMTKCVPGTSFNENFDSTPAFSLPSCWSKIIRGDFNAQNFASVNNIALSPNSAPNNISMFNSGYNASNDIILVSPPMDNLANGTHKLTLFLKGQNNLTGIQIGTLDTNTNEAVFTEFTTIDVTSSYAQYTIDFSDYDGSDLYIGIRHSALQGNRALYVDNVVWEPIVTEACPAVSEVNENFDTTAIDTVPECWTAILRGPSENTFDSIGVRFMDGAPTTPHTMNITKGLSTAEDDQILVLPKLSNLSAGTHKLAFSHAGPPCQIEVGTLSDNTENAVFTFKEAFTVGSDWTQSVSDFANYAGTDTYIGLRLNGGASAFVSMFVDNVIWTSDLGTGSFDNSKFAYYPNPVKNILNLSYEQNITDVAVYNLLGQEIITKKFNANQTQIDMSGLASGTYLVKVTANNTNKTFKVIKE